MYTCLALISDHLLSLMFVLIGAPIAQWYAYMYIMMSLEFVLYK